MTPASEQRAIALPGDDKIDTGRKPGATLRIAQVIQSVDAPAGGTSTAFLGVVGALRAQPGLSVRAFSTPPPAGDPHWGAIEKDRRDFGYASWTLSAGVGRYFQTGALGLAVGAAITAGEVDLLHLHGLWCPDLVHSARVARRASVPVVWQPHGMLVGAAIRQKRLKKEVFLATGLRRALCDARAIIYCTREEQEQSLPPRAIPRACMHVVPLPLDAPAGLPARAEMQAAARARFGIPAAAKTVVFMGRLHPVKRVELAMEAVADASRSLPDLHLLLVGDGEAEYVSRLRALAARLGIAGRVCFAGFVSGADKWGALAAGDVLTLNSKHENFGFVAVEALCVGTLPVMTSNLALAPELAGVDGGISCEATPHALAAAYVRAIGHPDREGLVSRGQAWVAEHLSARAVGRSLDGLYRALLTEQ